MKAKLFVLFMVLALILPFRAMADTEDIPRGQNALRKLCRGFANVLFGIVEVPNQITKTTAAHGGGAGVTYGVGKGFRALDGTRVHGGLRCRHVPGPLSTWLQADHEAGISRG